MPDKKEEDVYNELLDNVYIRNFFFGNFYMYAKTIGFCGWSTDKDRNITLYKDQGSYYEPFTKSEFDSSSIECSLFLSIEGVLRGFDVSRSLLVGLTERDLIKGMADA